MNAVAAHRSFSAMTVIRQTHPDGSLVSGLSVLQTLFCEMICSEKLVSSLMLIISTLAVSLPILVVTVAEVLSEL